MRDGLDMSIVASGALIKKGYSFLIANVGKTVALITLAVTALVSFTEIGFAELTSEGFTSTLIMMLIASYIMYFSLADAGENLGRDSDGYKAALKEYTCLKEQISGDDIGNLRSFCLEYRNAELEYRRANLLFSLGYTEDEYKEYLNGAEMTKTMRKALVRVKKMRRSDLDAASLLSSDNHSKSELKNPESSRLYNMILRLIPSTVCMLFTVSIMVSLKDNMTGAGVIEALIKLSTLPIIGLKGYSGGYEYVTGSEIGWIETKTRLLDSFIKSYKHT